MRLSRSAWFWSLSKLRHGAAVVILSFGATAIAGPLSPIVPGNLDLVGGSPAATVMVDWNTSLIVTSLATSDDVDRPEIPSLDPDNFQMSADETASDVAKSEASDVADTTTPDANGEGYGEIYKYKFGHLGGNYPESADASTPDEPAANDNGTTPEIAKADLADELTVKDDSKSDEPDKTVNAPFSEAADAQDYFTYRSESVDGHYGKDAAAAEVREEAQSGDDAKATDDANEDANEDEKEIDNKNETSETADDESDGSAFADALSDVFSRWVDVVVANYGLDLARFSQTIAR